jgi:molybdopterin molybdotransferase
MTVARKIVSEIGLTELRPVRCLGDGSAEPIAFFAEAGLSALTEADGFVLVPEKSEGYPRGATVTVYLYSGYDRAQPQ